MPYVGQKPADIISTAVDTVTGKFSGEVDAASLDISGNIDVDGTTNLDVVDIDGAVDMATTLAVTGALSAKGGAVFNEDSADVDFRVESNGNANMLVIDGGDDVISIGAAKDTGATVKIQNKDDGNTNTLDLFNDNGNRTITMQQDTAGNAKMRFQKNDGTFTTTIDANLGGILFGTDTAAANTLSDYEEGTFTPAPSVGTVSSASGEYTKIGRLVSVRIKLATGFDTTTDAVQLIQGLPFTTSSADRAIGSAMMNQTDNANRFGTAYIDSNSKIQLYSASETGAFDAFRCTDLNSSNAGIYISATYETAS